MLVKTGTIPAPKKRANYIKIMKLNKSIVIGTGNEHI